MNSTKKVNRKNWFTLEDHQQQLMKDPKFVKAYKEAQPEFEIIEKMIQSRIKKGFTQASLARRLKTKQSAISRLESGNANPSLNFLKRLAAAFDSHLEIRFLPK